MKTEILSISESLKPQLVSMRRAFHREPEPSFSETETQARIRRYLKQAGIRLTQRASLAGVVGLLEGSGPGTIALRSDMDALNITEQTGLAFASRRKGFMHACGHDAHMAIVLGAGLVLKHLGRRLPGRVKLIFQPAEETPPGGAPGMIKQGVLRAPKVDAILGLHVVPSVSSGKIAFNRGAISAAADDFRVTITGSGGHGSKPQVGVDAIVVAAQFLTALQTVVARRVDPLDSAVVSVGRIVGGDRANVIADRVEMEGTLRAKSETTRRALPRMIKRILRSTCAASGARGAFELVEGYPAVVVDEDFTDLVEKACIELLGRGRVTSTREIEMGGEDFAYYVRRVPGTMMFIGVHNKRKGIVHPLHHPRFDIDEDVLVAGTAAMAYSAFRYLSICADGGTYGARRRGPRRRGRGKGK